jgi:hypothetical protein
MRQLDGKGHVHTDEKYREFMRKFTQTQTMDEMLTLMNVDTKLREYFGIFKQTQKEWAEKETD